MIYIVANNRNDRVRKIRIQRIEFINQRSQAGQHLPKLLSICIEVDVIN